MVLAFLAANLLPPQALLIRRMEGLVFSTLGELRAIVQPDRAPTLRIP